MPTVKVNDINMYYEIHGEGEPLIMIQGMGIDVSVLGPHITSPEKYLWLVFDNRGVGRTDKPDEPYSIEMMADDTIGLMDALGIKRAHFLGTSLGSYISLVIAEKYPERVNGLVLSLAAARSTAKDNPITAGMYDQLRIMLQQPGFVEKMSKYPPTVKSILRQLDAIMEYDASSQLSKVRTPALIVNGTKDVSTPVKFAHELEDGIHGAKLILLEGDHFFIAAKPELLLDPMYGFLADVDAKLAGKALKPAV